jgi:hypothetical protein
MPSRGVRGFVLHAVLRMSCCVAAPLKWWCAGIQDLPAVIGSGDDLLTKNRAIVPCLAVGLLAV